MLMQKRFSALFSFITGVLAPPRPTEHIIDGLTIETLQSLARYDGSLPYHERAVRALVWELKYRGSTHAATLAGEFLSEQLLAIAQEEIGRPLLIPVPMHPERRKEAHDIRPVARRNPEQAFEAVDFHRSIA